LPWHASQESKDKRRSLIQHRSLKLNTTVVHDYPERFDEHAVDMRGARLTELVTQLWPGPKAHLQRIVDVEPRVVLRRALSNPSTPLVELINPSRDGWSNANIPAFPQANEVDPRCYQMNRRLSSAELTQLVELYRSGKSMRELAHQFGIHRVTVSRLLKREGVELRNGGLSADEIDHAVALYAEGKSLARIGEHFGVDHGTVWRHLKKRGVRMRDTHGRAKVVGR
jgi:DNA-binding MarR family transcriptional regulator